VRDVSPFDRIGNDAIPVDPEKIKGIVLSDVPDTPSDILPPDEETKIMADHGNILGSITRCSI